jgi:hypothetical protein
VFSARGDTDIDRFQESALFPGDKVAVVHAVPTAAGVRASERYSAWGEAPHRAGLARQVLGYGQRLPYRVITGATARTTYTPEGRAYRACSWTWASPAGAGRLAGRTAGERAAGAHLVGGAAAGTRGRWSLAGPGAAAALADTAADYLPLTPANLLQQAFKFLGERYGWGHVRHPRLQRLRLRDLPQLRRAAAAQHQRAGGQPGLAGAAAAVHRRPAGWPRCQRCRSATWSTSPAT